MRSLATRGFVCFVLTFGACSCSRDIPGEKIDQVLLRVKQEVSAYQQYMKVARQADSLRTGIDTCPNKPNFMISKLQFEFKTVVSHEDKAGFSLKIPFASGAGDIAPALGLDNTRTNTQDLTFYTYPQQNWTTTVPDVVDKNAPIAVTLEGLRESLLDSSLDGNCMDYSSGVPNAQDKDKENTFAISFEVKKAPQIGLGFSFLILSANASRTSSRDRTNTITVSFKPEPVRPTPPLPGHSPPIKAKRPISLTKGGRMKKYRSQLLGGPFSFLRNPSSGLSSNIDEYLREPAGSLQSPPQRGPTAPFSAPPDQFKY